MAWINGYQVWLSESQSLQNAQKVVDFLYTNTKDWSKESIAALVGNMRHESSVNPNMYEYGKEWTADRGFGLVQWTPRSKFWDWAASQGYTETERRNGESQLARIDYEVANNIQYIANGHQVRYGNGDKYDFSFADFRSNAPGLTVDQLTEAFMWNYEGPAYSAGSSSLAARQAFANRAFNELVWVEGDDPVPEPPEDGPDDTPGGIDVGGFAGEMVALIRSMLSKNVYRAGESQFYQNQFIQLRKQLDTVYKVKGTDPFYQAIVNKLQGFNDDYLPPDPDPEPVDPTPEETKVFPVKIQNGINFWKRSKWGVGTLQRNMTYGVRSTGANHYGYDIGGGGVKHTIYSVTNGVVTRANFANGIGNRITIQNSDDSYYLEYGHLDSFLVTTGDSVTAGQPIAIMGDTGGNYAIHLDLKISTTPTGFYSYDTTIDPEGYLQVTDDNTTTLPQPD